MTEPSWDDARALAREQQPLDVVRMPQRLVAGLVLAEDALAPAPVPHYDSSAMDGWAVAGPPPWRIGTTPANGGAVEIVTGGAIPGGTVGILPVERGTTAGGLLDGPPPAPGDHIRRAGEEAAAGAVLVAAGTRLSPAHTAVLGIAGIDELAVRPRPRIALVLTGDEVVQQGLPAPGRVRDAFDPLLPFAIEQLGGTVARVVRVGDDAGGIRAAIEGDEDLVITVGGTGRSRADRLRTALGTVEPVFDGVAMRPGHPTVLVRRPAPLLGLPGNPLAAVAALLSFLPPILDGLTVAAPAPLRTARAATDLGGWRGTSLVPCCTTAAGIAPAPAARPNMLRGLALSDLLAVVPPEGAPAGAGVRVLPLPW